MTITFVQRSLIFFAVLLCYYQSWVCAVNCEQEPYNPACRGSQVKRRQLSLPLPVMRVLSNCEEGDCRIPRNMKFLIAIVEDTPYRDNEIHSNSESNHRKGRMRVQEEAKDMYMDDY